MKSTLVTASTPFDPRCAHVTSPLFGPRILAALRLTFALWTTVTIIYGMVRSGMRGELNEYFSFFTRLSYLGLCFYFWFAGFHTLSYTRHCSRRVPRHTYSLQSWPRLLQVLHVTLECTIMVFPVIVTAVFWSLLSKPTTLRAGYNAWDNLSVHALNTALAGFEIFFTNIPPPSWWYVIPTAALLASYLGVAYITEATQGFYPYPFLNPSGGTGKLVAYIFGIAAGCVIMFAVVWALLSLRSRVVGAVVGKGWLRDRMASVDATLDGEGHVLGEGRWGSRTGMVEKNVGANVHDVEAEAGQERKHSVQASDGSWIRV